MALQQRAAAAAFGTTQRSCVRPAFKPFSSGRRARVARAAEEEGPVADEAPVEAATVAADSFTFDIKEARRGNSYEPSDVQAALNYYTSGSGDLPYEADFAVNRFGTEDAAFFDDIDDNEGYAASEYLSVGIEEAAPKLKQRNRDDDEAFDEAVEEFDQERAASAAFEGVEVLDADLLDDVDADDAPWAWEAGATNVSAAAIAAASDGAEAEEERILAALAGIDFEALKDEDVEQRELASMVVDALGDDLDLVALADSEGEVAAGQELTPAEEAKVSEVLAIDAAAPAPELDAAVAAALAELAAAAPAAGEALPAAEVEAYLAQLRAVDAAAAGGDASLLGEGVRKEAASIPAGELPALGDLSVPALPAALLAADAALESPLGDGAEEADAELAAFARELAEVEAIQVADYNNPLGSAAMFPEEADLETYESILDATAEYMAATGDEVTGELFEEEGADDAAINPYDDLDDSLVARSPLVELEDDDDNFQERILELSRVTKVVKGGKIMGFRAVVVVGDGAGRVGVGCQSGREVATAVKRSLVDAKKNLVRVPLVGAGTLPHRSEAWFKAAGVVVVPASEGTGVIAGGAVRSVLELAGVQNVLAKRLGSRSVLNNARVTVKALEQLRTLSEVARMRDLPLQALLQ